MELKTKHIVNKAKGEIVLFLYGNIGKDEAINGDWFAKDLYWCQQNYDVVTIRINSYGGDVREALSIVCIMRDAAAEIVTKVDGVAASMAAVIAVSGDRVIMNDFAQIMIHEALYLDNEGNAIPMADLSPKNKKALKRANEQISKILARMGKAQEEIADLMKKETWFNADEALSAKLIDEVINTGRVTELAALQPRKLVAQLTDEIFKTDTDMKLIAQVLGKPENSTEQQLVDAINARETDLKAREDALKANQKALVDRMIESGKASGAVTDDNEADMRELADANFKLFNKMVGTKPAEGGESVKELRLSYVIDAIKNQGGAGFKRTEAEEFDHLQKNDPAALKAMESGDNAKFKRLQNAYNESLK